MSKPPKVTVMPIGEGAAFDPNNVNKHTQKGGTLLENSLRKRGAFRSIASAGKNVETPVVMAGNYTLEKAISAGFTEIINVHVTGNQIVNVVRDDLDPNSPEAIALGIEDNEIGKQSYNPDIDMLAALTAGDNAILSHLRHEDKTFGSILNDLTIGLGAKTKSHNGGTFAGIDNDITVNGGNAFDITDTRLYFDTKLALDFPPLRDDFLYDGDLSGIKLWAGENASEPSDLYFYNHNTDSTYNLDFKKCILGFYADDDKWEGDVWDNFAEFAAKLYNLKPVAVVCPNFSHYIEWPKIVRLHNYYRSLWVGRFWQECSIKIIPDLKLGYLDTEQVLVGMPTNAPIMCTQFNVGSQKAGADFLSQKITFLEEALDQLKPKQLIIYGSNFGYTTAVDAVKRCGVIPHWVPSRVEVRRQYMAKRSQRR